MAAGRVRVAQRVRAIEVFLADIDDGMRAVRDGVVYDRKNPSSIVGSLQAARENARRAREVVSSELWETLNATWNAWPAVRRRSLSPHEFLAWVLTTPTQTTLESRISVLPQAATHRYWDGWGPT